MCPVTGVQTASKQAHAVTSTQGHAPSDVHHDYDEHGPDERPEDWGWHGETGKFGRIGAWAATLFLLLFLVGNEPLVGPGHVAVIGFVVVMVVIMLWDRSRRKNAWRAR